MKKVEIKTVSAAKLLLYLDCPRRFYYTYEEGITRPDTKYTRFGSFIHAVLEKYVKRLVANAKNNDIEALYSIVEAEKKNYSAIPESGELSFFEADVFLNRFASENTDPRRIYALEKSFDIPFCCNGSIRINGRIDRIDREEAGGDGMLLHIIDYKTGKKELTEQELANDLQMKFYITAAYLLYRKTYSRFRVSHHYLRDNSRVSFDTDYSDKFAEEITGLIMKMKNDASYPRQILHRCRMCPAFGVCKPDMRGIKK